MISSQNTSLISTLSPLSLFPNAANGCAARLCFLWLLQVISCLPIFFSITDMLLNICFTSDKLMHNSAHNFLNYGITLFIGNGAPFSVCVPLLNILVLCLRIPLFLSFRMMLTLLMMTFMFLNTPYAIRIGNFTWLRLHSVGKTAQVKNNQLMLPLLEPFTSSLKTPFTSL